MQQNHVFCNFSSSESWIILSPIEQSIKRKIEAVGTLLKDWGVSIHRGILTGCDEAFIIKTGERNKILQNCKDEDERTRTEELIRPILRGRDIKRYGYNWSGLWLISTFPSRHYDIDDYPAVKSYLLAFGKQRLEQTGKLHMINNVGVKSRKKTNNKWFELQDSISYWEDFYKPKIVWGNLNLSASYALVLDTYFVNAPSPLIVPASKYLLAILNSKLIDYYVRLMGVSRNGGYFEYKPMYVEKIPIPAQDQDTTSHLEHLVDMGDEKGIDRLIYKIYDISEDEISYIEKSI